MLTLRDRLRFELKSLPNDIIKEELLDNLEEAVKTWLHEGATSLTTRGD